MKNIIDCIGNTPLVKIPEFLHKTEANIFAKLEYMNPSGSLKDRIVLQMIEDAEKSGEINPKTTIVEPTSGNTGIALAFICAIKRYPITLVMPENMSAERKRILRLYGADIKFSNPKDGFKGAINLAYTLSENMDNAIVLNQYDNQSNTLGHYNSTGPELWNDTDGNIDVFISGVGTGGMISGVSRYFKEKTKNFKSVAVEPIENNILSGGDNYSKHFLQGIGPNFIPGNFHSDLIDDIFHVSKEQAIEKIRLLNKSGLPVGISTGATAHCAFELGKKNPGKNIVFIAGSSSERYLSCDDLFE